MDITYRRLEEGLPILEIKSLIFRYIKLETVLLILHSYYASAVSTFHEFTFTVYLGIFSNIKNGNIRYQIKSLVFSISVQNLCFRWVMVFA